MEAWKNVWHKGIAPQLSTAGLMALEKALSDDDVRLLQSATTEPPPLHCMRERSVEGACVIAYCGWQGGGLQLVGDVQNFFAGVCYEASCRGGDQEYCDKFFSCGEFLSWVDGTSREEMRRMLLPEVQFVLEQRNEF